MTVVDNREIARRFFEFLRAMVNTLVENPNDDGEMKELEYLANYIKDIVGDAFEQYEDDKIPVLSLTVYGSKDGKTDARFEIPRNLGIIQSWKLKELSHALNEQVEKWDESHLEQPEPEGFDTTPYQIIKEIIKGGKGN